MDNEINKTSNKDFISINLKNLGKLQIVKILLMKIVEIDENKIE